MDNMEHIDKIKDILNKYLEVEKVIAESHVHNREWYFNKIVEYIEVLFERAPFKPGDRVRLTKTPVIEENSGWRGAKHFLVEGAVGTVMAIDVRYHKFCAHVTFDNETWIESASKKEHPVHETNRGWFLFYENQLEVIRETPTL